MTLCCTGKRVSPTGGPMRGRGAAGRLAMRRGGRHRGGAAGRGGGALSRGAARGGVARGQGVTMFYCLHSSKTKVVLNYYKYAWS